MKRLLALLILTQSPALAASDPWPAAPVLTRLLVLPSGKADGQRLVSGLGLTEAQVRELRRLAASEGAAGEAGRRVIGRQEAARLNAKITAMNAEKDRKVRVLLGGKYPAFRSWVRTWWGGEVQKAARP